MALVILRKGENGKGLLSWLELAGWMDGLPPVQSLHLDSSISINVTGGGGGVVGLSSLLIGEKHKNMCPLKFTNGILSMTSFTEKTGGYSLYADQPINSSLSQEQVFTLQGRQAHAHAHTDRLGWMASWS